MENTLVLPRDWPMIGVQCPLFLEHCHVVEVRRIRLLGPKRIRVKWKVAQGRKLKGREFSETFNLCRQKGKERLKDFLFSLPFELGTRIVDLDDCLGKCIEVMAVERPAGTCSRVEILHHLLG